MLNDDDLELIMTYWKLASRPPVSTIVLPGDSDPVEWFRDCLSKSTSQAVYGIAIGTPETIEGQDPVLTALTGNGVRSRANADFYVLCHTVIPDLVQEVRRLRDALDVARDE